jgi:Sulfotransferase family
VWLFKKASNVMMGLSITNMFTRKASSNSYYTMLFSAAVVFCLARYQTSIYLAQNFEQNSRRAQLEDKLNLPQHISLSYCSSTAGIHSSISLASMLKHHQTNDQHIPLPTPVTNSTPSLVPIYQADNLLIQQGDSIHLRQGWDNSPVVLEEYKLIFFTTAKVGCTVWKQLFRRMMGYEDWKAENTKQSMLPWNPEANGLKYLHHYSRQEASAMMTSPEWTRAIFVRDPKERFLSAYLDKVVQNPFFTRHVCCPHKMDCVSNQTSLQDFLQLVQTCENNQYVLIAVCRFDVVFFA